MRVLPTHRFLPVPADFTRFVRLGKRQSSLVIIAIMLLFLSSRALAEEGEGRVGVSPPSTWEWVKGSKADDALFLDMRSLHLDGTGDFGNHSANENNQLLGLQIYGFDAGTFVNSHRERSYFLGLSRTVYTKSLSANTHMDVGYKVGAVYGYGKEFLNVGGFTPLIYPAVAFSYKWAGIEFGGIPVGVLTASFRIDLDSILPGSKNRN